MLLKICLKSAASRMCPFRLTKYRTVDFHKKNHVLSVNRSPHIDKRAQEQFRFHTIKKTSFIKTKTPELLLQRFRKLQQTSAPFQIFITGQETTIFKTRF